MVTANMIIATALVERSMKEDLVAINNDEGRGDTNKINGGAGHTSESSDG